MKKKLAFAVLVTLAAVGCSQRQNAAWSGPSAPAASSPSATPGSTGIPPGMNAAGEVVDASKVEGGHGQEVKGIDDTDGEITGKPAPGTRFDQVRIGMSMKQVTDLIGPPTDQGVYRPGDAFIPFYIGGDRHRHEMAYKGQGRLVFSGGSLGDPGGGRLIWIIHSASESGYR